MKKLKKLDLFNIDQLLTREQLKQVYGGSGSGGGSGTGWVKCVCGPREFYVSCTNGLECAEKCWSACNNP